jgi:phosphohistidine phosphatase
MKKLHLLRHAKAKAFSNSGEDFDRILHEKAESQLKLVNQYLQIQNPKFDKVFCSSAKRTRQTLKLLGFLDSNIEINYSDDLYLASENQLIRFVCENGNGVVVLIIGHNDGLSELASYLTNKQVHLETANYCVIGIDVENWSEVSKNTGKLETLFAPKIEE